MTKREMERERDERGAEEKKTCGCRWNMDDKFEEMCDEHAAEADERARHEWQ